MNFPSIIEIDDIGSRTGCLAHAQRNSVDWLAEAARNGALLLRGLPLESAEDFDAFVTAIGLPPFAYEESLSNAHRIALTPRVFTANEAPGSETIHLHHEMAQTPLPPTHLFFFCAIAAEEGGATPVCRSDRLWESLARETPDFARDCERLGLRYTNTMPAEADTASTMGRSWRSLLGTDDHESAEARLGTLGYSWEWLDDGALRMTTPRLPAVRELPDGRRSFFNQLIAATRGWNDARNEATRAISFGDGSPLPAEGVEAAAEFAREWTVDLAWQRGDAAILDNHVVMHGRRPYRGTRRVLAALGMATDKT